MSAVVEHSSCIAQFVARGVTEIGSVTVTNNGSPWPGKFGVAVINRKNNLSLDFRKVTPEKTRKYDRLGAEAFQGQEIFPVVYSGDSFASSQLIKKFDHLATTYSFVGESINFHFNLDEEDLP